MLTIKPPLMDFSLWSQYKTKDSKNQLNPRGPWSRSVINIDCRGDWTATEDCPSCSSTMNTTSELSISEENSTPKDGCDNASNNEACPVPKSEVSVQADQDADNPPSNGEEKNVKEQADSTAVKTEDFSFLNGETQNPLVFKSIFNSSNVLKPEDNSGAAGEEDGDVSCFLKCVWGLRPTS